jgi:hydrogenase/urease accessory protein HupE
MRLLVALVVLFAALPARAHRFQRSYAELSRTPEGADATLDLDPDDFDETLHPRFDNDRSGLVEGPELERHAVVLGGILAAGMVVERGGSRCRAQVESTRAVPAAGMVRATLSYACAEAGALRVEMPIFERLRPGHAHFLTVRLDDRVAAGVLTSDAPVWEEEPSVWKPAWRFLLLGVEHILVGYDHLLFLFALLLVTTRLRQLIGVVSAFTAAHSITLIAAALGAVRLPASIVEPAIAATIIYVGVENFFVRDARRRWLLTFALGLVHGFGFAGLVAEMGLPATGRVLTLLSFNVGVELGQVAAVSLVWPLMKLARARAGDVLFERWVLRGGSGVVVGLGAFWLVLRLL